MWAQACSCVAYVESPIHFIPAHTYDPISSAPAPAVFHCSSFHSFNSALLLDTRKAGCLGNQLAPDFPANRGLKRRVAAAADGFANRLYHCAAGGSTGAPTSG